MSQKVIFEKLEFYSLIVLGTERSTEQVDNRFILELSILFSAESIPGCGLGL